MGDFDQRGPTPSYPAVPPYGIDDSDTHLNPLYRGPAQGYEGQPAAAAAPVQRRGDATEMTPMLRDNRQRAGGYTSDVAFNPDYGHGASPVRTQTFKTMVRNILDELPSTRREIHNMVEAATRYRTRVASDNVMDLMYEGRAEPGWQRNSASYPADDNHIPGRGYDARDGYDDEYDPVFRQYATGRFQTGATAATPVPWVDDNLQQIDDMRKNIREQDSNIEVKRARARKLNSEMEDRKKKIGRFQLWWSLTVQGMYAWLSKTLHALERSSLWAAQIKALQGKHGHHVGIYFKFLRWCLALNTLIMIIMAVFVIVPFSINTGFDDSDRVIYGTAASNVTEFDTFVGLFNGGGALNASAYFMGTYFLPDAVPFGLTNTSGSIFDPNGAGDDGGTGGAYNVALAYLVVIGAMLLLSFIMIFWGVYTAIRQSVLQVGTKIDEQLATVVLCRLDYSINQKASMTLHRRDIKNEIKTLLDEGSAKEAYVNRMSAHWKRIYFKRVLINLLMLAILVLCLYGIFAAVEQSNTTGAGSLVPALVLSVVNAVVPFLFEKLAFAEEWRTELTVIKYTIIRAIVLRFVGLYVFFYAAYRRVNEFECWESYLGQEAYTVFVIGSILFEILTGCIVDMSVTLAFNHSKVCRDFLGEPAYFDTIKKTLEMTYAQALIWVGTYFCPLLPLVGILRLFVLFYVQMWSTMTWCQPKQKRFLSGHSLPKLIWSLFLASFVLVAIPLGYVIPRAASSGLEMPPEWQDRFVDNLQGATTPCTGAEILTADNCALCFDAAVTSADVVCWQPVPGGGRFPDGASVTAQNLCNACPRGCGPFRNEASAYSVVEREYSSWSPDLKSAVSFLGTSAFTVLLGFALLGCCLTTHAKSSALLMYARKLQVERDMERLDKRWILERYAITFEEARIRNESRAESEAAGYLDDVAPAEETGSDGETRYGGQRIVKQEAV